MELSYLYYFKVIAELENMSRAADVLHVSQPALSKTISKLEASLGVSLFQRKRGNIRLTEVGQAYYIHIARAFACIEDGNRELEAYKKSCSEEVAIASPVGELLSNLVMDFLAARPDSRIRISQYLYSPEVLLEHLLGGQLDFALTPIPVASHEIEQVKLMEEEVFLVVSASHPLAKQKFVRLADLKDERFLVNDASFDRKIVIDHCHLAGFEPNISLCSNEQRIVTEAVEAGRGVSFVPGNVILAEAQRGQNEGRVAVLRFSDVEVVRFLSLARRKNRILSDGARQLYRYSCDYFRRLDAKMHDYFGRYFPPADFGPRQCLNIKDMESLRVAGDPSG